jgi:2-amino-4-hydroxy-6-hydroxymethyldihydropteridine diphosphokinase
MGSNIDPRQNIVRAFEVLSGSVQVVAASRIFETDPVASSGVPLFLNAALELDTVLEPGELKFEVLRPAEARLGRRRSSDRNAPRQIDLDLVLYGDRVFSDGDEGIELPDPDILRYPHVALPLADVAPNRLHPLCGRTLEEIAASFGTECGVRLAANSGGLREKVGSEPASR